MTPRSSKTSLSRAQRERLDTFEVQRSVDLHCHCLAGLDDGPASVLDALAICRAFVDDGFTDVIATPHQLGRYDGVNWAAEIRRGVRGLQAALEQEQIPLRVHPGAEIRLDERIPSLLQSDQLMTLCDGGEFLLLELPTAGSVLPAAVTSLLGGADLTVILAHAERYDSLRRDPMLAESWIDAGIILQVNAASVLGDAGSGSEEAAMQWLDRGWISVIATDAHNVAVRPPRMTAAIDLITRRFGREIARELCITNPARLLEGERRR